MVVEDAFRDREERLRADVIDILSELISINIKLAPELRWHGPTCNGRVGELESQWDIVAARHIQLEIRGIEMHACTL